MEDSLVSTIWTMGLKPEEKEEFIRVLKLEKSSKVYNRLLDIIKIKRTALEASEMNTETYDSPSWAYKQSHNNGARQMLLFIEKLLGDI